MRTTLNMFLVISLALIFTSGILITYTIGQQYYLLALALAYIIIFIIFLLGLLRRYRDFSIFVDKRYLLLSILFLTSNLVSVISNAEVNLILSSLQYFSVYFVLIIVASNLQLNMGILKISLVFCWMHFIFLLLATVLSLPVTYPFLAIFDNSNTMGVLATSLFVTSFTIFLSLPRKKSNFFHFIFIVFSFILIVYSGSRNALITSLTIILISIVIKQYKQIRKVQRNILYLFLNTIKWPLTITGILIVTYFSFQTFFKENILAKFERKASTGDVFDQRTYIWERTFQEASLFGNGSTYFESNFGIGAHNTFVAILGQFGIISSIVFLLLILLFLYDSIKYLF